MTKIFISILLTLAMLPQAQANKPSKPKRGLSEFIAAVVKTSEGNLEVWLNTRDVWEEKGALTDSYVEEGQMERADALTEEANLCNLMESTYEPCETGQGIPQRSQKQLMRELEALGVEIEPEFQKWAQEEIQ